MRFDPTPEQRAAMEAAGRGGRGGRGGGGGGGGRGRGGRGGGGPQGPEADPGVYRIVMTANGKQYTGRIVIRQDPMLGPDRRVTTDGM
jgi:hypothetical protein